MGKPFRPAGIVTLTTDFGTRDGYVGAMKGVILSLGPGLAIHDIAHEVSPHDVAHGAAVLRTACPWFPAGTVHVGVVDPGVGSGRAAIAVLAGGHALVGPDNGLLSLAAVVLGGVDDARRIERAGALAKILPERPSATFHGRDIFAPVAAALASGRVLPGDLGPPHEPMVLEPARPRSGGRAWSGHVTYIDRFGNAITNLPATALEELRDSGCIVSTGDHEIDLVRTYADVDEGAPCALLGSDGWLEIAERDGSAAAHLGVSPGDEVHVRPRDEAAR